MEGVSFIVLFSSNILSTSFFTSSLLHNKKRLFFMKIHLDWKIQAPELSYNSLFFRVKIQNLKLGWTDDLGIDLCVILCGNSVNN